MYHTLYHTCIIMYRCSVSHFVSGRYQTCIRNVFHGSRTCVSRSQKCARCPLDYRRVCLPVSYIYLTNCVVSDMCLIRSDMRLIMYTQSRVGNGGWGGSRESWGGGWGCECRCEYDLFLAHAGIAPIVWGSVQAMFGECLGGLWTCSKNRYIIYF